MSGGSCQVTFHSPTLAPSYSVPEDAAPYLNDSAAKRPRSRSCDLAACLEQHDGVDAFGEPFAKRPRWQECDRCAPWWDPEAPAPPPSHRKRPADWDCSLVDVPQKRPCLSICSSEDATSSTTIGSSPVASSSESEKSESAKRDDSEPRSLQGCTKLVSHHAANKVWEQIRQLEGTQYKYPEWCFRALPPPSSDESDDEEVHADFILARQPQCTDCLVKGSSQPPRAGQLIVFSAGRCSVEPLKAAPSRDEHLIPGLIIYSDQQGQGADTIACTSLTEIATEMEE